MILPCFELAPIMRAFINLIFPAFCDEITPPLSPAEEFTRWQSCITTVVWLFGASNLTDIRPPSLAAKFPSKVVLDIFTKVLGMSAVIYYKGFIGKPRMLR